MDEIPTHFIYNNDGSHKTSHSVSFYDKSKRKEPADVPDDQMTGPDGCVHDVPRPAPRVSASEKPAGIPVGCGGTQAEPKIYHSVANNYRVDDRQLVVNCTGRVDLPFWFRTHEINGLHDFYLMYLTSGRMTALVDGKEYDVQAGDAVIFPPEREYRYEKTSTADIQYHWAHFSGYSAAALLSRLGFGMSGVFRIGIDETISMLFMQLVEDFIMGDGYSELSAGVKLTEILIAIRRALDRPQTDRPESIDRVFASIKYIHENFKRPLSNELLAEIEHLSVSQYIELFKKSTGSTPRNYIIELRVRNACDLLSRSYLPLKEIAMTVGYDDPHYFSRIFKNHRGVSPEAYRRGETRDSTDVG